MQLGCAAPRSDEREVPVLSNLVLRLHALKEAQTAVREYCKRGVRSKAEGAGAECLSLSADHVSRSESVIRTMIQSLTSKNPSSVDEEGPEKSEMAVLFLL